MTLRARLTTAFLVMVLGPVVLSALFVGVAVERLGQERADQRLELATANVRTAVGALCAQLSTVAETIAAAPAERRLGLSGQFVERGLASGVHLARGADGANTKGAPPLPWADCAGSVEKGTGIAAGYSAIAAQVATPDGALVTAAFTADLALVKRLGAASGADVTLLGGTGVRPPTTETALTGMRRVADSVPLSPAPSTLEDASAVARVADTLADGGAGRADTGDLVRRIGPVAGEPLPIAVSVPVGSPRGTQMMLVSVVLLTALAAVGVASWLARTATSPLAGLAAAADRVAAGDLHTRVPARGRDEVAHLATAFNRMTRELETYVSALTASRDQLRGNLGILGETLSSTHDRDRILQVILHTARQATQASGAIVLLADNGGELVGKCAEGLRREASEVRVPIGQGLCGAVAATGVPRLGRVDRDGPALAPGEPACRTYLVVPFAAPRPAGTARPGSPPARGVLALYDRLGRRHGCDDFDDQDLMTLLTFAGQAAVAVDNVRLHEEAQRLSVTDSLTGLLNHRSLCETLRREAERAARFGRKFAVLALDLDHFKEINDRYGHAAGDAVLIEFARRIKDEIREVDLAFRVGGDEFVLLLPETDTAGGVAVAERLAAAVRDAAVAVSIGIAVLPDDGVAGSEVLRAADDALYAAKAAGRNTFRVAGNAFSVRTGGAASAPPAATHAQGR